MKMGFYQGRRLVIVEMEQNKHILGDFNITNDSNANVQDVENERDW